MLTVRIFLLHIYISTKDVFNYFNAHKVQERKILLIWREHGSHLKAHFLSTKYSDQNADRFLHLELLQKEYIARVLSKPKMNMCNKYLYYYYYLIFLKLHYYAILYPQVQNRCYTELQLI